MNQPTTERMRWTIADLELLPQDDRRYEIIDGELLVTRAPHWGHQKAAGRSYSTLEQWSLETQLGEASFTPGLIFGEADNVIPDVVWISRERLAASLDQAGHLTAAPELVVEVLSSGAENVRRDRELKLRLYSTRGVREYWIIDWQAQQMEVYRRESAALALVATLFPSDEVTSPMLPGFRMSIASLFT
ncbi:MAG: Uma2 family endonuclease [Plectolyngbya sp. WJT66-NPBG17]|jgi:Uma2 family endonuclease|nr:Uma2 family endonuclease [Plectolyngbya sp. WJT66-NPBG17]MBW4527168.1 Uma2 family endonuclease [Phormidium tanganyikae FI6-MK23]